MATNPWISKEVRSEQNLYEDLVIESLQFYGQDVYYLPRELVNVDKVFLDDVPSHFSDAYKIEMYVENADGFGGEGDLFSKFGVELRDQATFVCARRRWKSLIGDKLDAYNFRPREGDVIYIPFSKSLFEIFKVETETPFYQLNQLPTFRLQCELFEYNDEDFDTGIDSIDDIEVEGAYQYKLTMETPSVSTAKGDAVMNLNGQITSIDMSTQGRGYLTAPTVTIGANLGGVAKLGNQSLNVLRGRGLEQPYSQTNVHGTIEMWVRVDTLPVSGQQVLFATGGTGRDAKTYFWGINSAGELVYSRGNNGGGGLVNLVGNNIIFAPDTWHHLLIGADATNNLVVYFDNVKKYDNNITGVTFDWISSNGYAVGSDAAREIDGVQWDAFTGYIDEFRAQVGSKSSLLVPRYVDSGVDTNLTPQTVEYTSDSATAVLEHFNAISATATSTIDASGRLESVIINDQGLYYEGEPTVTFSAPSTGGEYKRNESIQQVTDNYTIKGEVVKWSDSDNCLYLAHVGATDGKFHTFNTSNAVIGLTSGAHFAPSLVGELQEIQSNYSSDPTADTPQANFFDDFEGDFLDFSESNPFGDMA
jgi:hypothetical protein